MPVRLAEVSSLPRHVGPEAQIQVISLGSKCLCLLRHGLERWLSSEERELLLQET